MALVRCPLCSEWLDEEDPLGAGAHMGDHLGVVDLGELAMLRACEHEVMMLVNRGDRGPLPEQPPPPDLVLPPAERLRREFAWGMGGGLGGG